MRGHGQRFELQSKLQQWLLTCGHVQLRARRVDWSTYMQWCVTGFKLWFTFKFKPKPCIHHCNARALK